MEISLQLVPITNSTIKLFKIKKNRLGRNLQIHTLSIAQTEVENTSNFENKSPGRVDLAHRYT